MALATHRIVIDLHAARPVPILSNARPAAVVISATECSVATGNWPLGAEGLRNAEDDRPLRR
jgi:hypothetical protein